ncbi:hypothetical protein C8J57DRAFT_1228861 [Mycena rebaudengoi]|nr:hypothetical protein C8J57DRAFT_1228861 [Mycena rebaudengoi]
MSDSLFTNPSVSYATVSGQWSPELPNTDLWTLTVAPGSPSTDLRRVVAVSTSPPGNLPSVPLYQSGRGRTTIGLGHPSTCRDTTTTKPISSARPLQPLLRICSSTVKQRTRKFKGRSLYTIKEEPDTPGPVECRRTLSYAETLSTAKTDRAQNHACTLRKASPSALPCRWTPSGAAHATPTQVQSPRVLVPATLAGSPCYQSLDKVAQAITASSDFLTLAARGEGYLGEQLRRVSVRKDREEEDEDRQIREVSHSEEQGSADVVQNLRRMRVKARNTGRRMAYSVKMLF